MGTMEQVKEAGLDEELNATLTQFLTDKASADDRQALETKIDEKGLKDPEVMKMISKWQGEGILNKGMYKVLVELNKKISSNGTSAEPAVEAKEGEEDDDSKLVLTEKQEEKIQARMEKEREKLEKRLRDKEEKIRERLSERATTRAKRLGLKAEEAGEIGELKTKIAAMQAEIKEKREEIKTCRARINEIRPKRPRKKKEGEEDGTEAAAEEKTE